MENSWYHGQPPEGYRQRRIRLLVEGILFSLGIDTSTQYPTTLYQHMGDALTRPPLEILKFPQFSSCCQDKPHFLYPTDIYVYPPDRNLRHHSIWFKCANTKRKRIGSLYVDEDTAQHLLTQRAIYIPRPQILDPEFSDDGSLPELHTAFWDLVKNQEVMSSGEVNSPNVNGISRQVIKLLIKYDKAMK